MATVMAAVMCAGGCGRDDDASNRIDEAADRTAVTRRAQAGPVKMTLTAAPGELDVSEHVTVRMEITAAQGVTVHADDYQRILADGDLRFEHRVIRSDAEEANPIEEGKLRWVYEYELEFFLPGEYELPAASVSFVDSRDLREEVGGQAGGVGPAEPQVLATEPLSIVVRQPAGQELSPEELARIKTLPPVELPPERNLWWIAAALAVVVSIVVLGVLLRRRRRHKLEQVVQIPADVWARREMAALVAEDLIAKGFVKTFYYRISDIVRGYVERRFHVLAPEMTTEEFLAAAASDRRFGEKNTGELTHFLNACDMVKYARHEPHTGESELLVKTAGAFVEKTRERIVHGAGDAGDSDGTREQAA
ncbi:MAG: hypothetical protein JSU63_05515 [Phycisphaerales bacterium]|nr:MAG: hypothetical protein JSU63_05515 [Phycisphaerales bacterium]